MRWIFSLHIMQYRVLGPQSGHHMISGTSEEPHEEHWFEAGQNPSIRATARSDRIFLHPSASFTALFLWLLGSATSDSSVNSA